MSTENNTPRGVNGSRQSVLNYRRSIWIDDKLWDACTKASAEYQLQTGEVMNRSKWIRKVLKVALGAPADERSNE
jgi:hypothetical protein